MKFLSDLKNKKLSNKTCLLRVDFNLTDAELSGENLRIKSVLPTIKFLISSGAKVIILSHRGRPTTKIQGLSLKPFAKILSKLLKKPIRFIDFKRGFDVSKIRKIITITRDSIFLFENLRFSPGEDKNDRKFAKNLASLGTFYVNDAFAFSHRPTASIVGIPKFLPSYAGLSLENEIKNLSKVMKNPKKPLIIILGGAKISDKIGVIKNFLKKVDKILIGGGVANTFLAAKKTPIGNSLYGKQMIPLARKLLKSGKIVLPIDWLMEKGRILDIGSETSRLYAEIIKNAKTIIWNGPMGYFENPKFAKGSEAIAQAITKSRAFSIIGGGETTTLISKTISRKSKVFLSTGGGAMLEYLSGKKLPGIEALNTSL